MASGFHFNCGCYLIGQVWQVLCLLQRKWISFLEIDNCRGVNLGQLLSVRSWQKMLTICEFHFNCGWFLIGQICDKWILIVDVLIAFVRSGFHLNCGCYLIGQMWQMDFNCWYFDSWSEKWIWFYCWIALDRRSGFHFNCGCYLIGQICDKWILIVDILIACLRSGFDFIVG